MSTAEELHGVGGLRNEEGPSGWCVCFLFLNYFGSLGGHFLFCVHVLFFVLFFICRCFFVGLKCFLVVCWFSRCF